MYRYQTGLCGVNPGGTLILNANNTLQFMLHADSRLCSPTLRWTSIRVLCGSPLATLLLVIALSRTLPCASLVIRSHLSTTQVLRMTASKNVEPLKNDNRLLSSQQEAQQFVAQSVLDGDSATSVVRCGNLTCQHDSFRRTLDTAKIVAFSAFEEKKNPKSKKGKGKKQASEQVASPLCSPIQYTLVLSDSVFFPEGGGQPSDRGTLTLNEAISLTVTNVQNIQTICVLTCAVAKEFPPESVLQALASPDAVIVQSIAWDRRLDLMTQHSGQHLISAVAANEFNILTHSFSLGQNSLTSYIDFVVDADLPWEDHVVKMKRVEEMVNEKILDNLPMTPTWWDPDDPEFATKVRSRLLPSGLTGKIRLVEIGGGVDVNTCCGTHVPTLGALQMIKCFKMEKVKSTVMRVYFAAGKRLTKILEESYERQSSITNLLCCSEDEHVSRLTLLLEDKKIKEKEIKELNTQLCDFRAKEIIQDLNDKNYVAVVDLGATDMAFMTMLSSSVMDLMESKDGATLLLIAAPDGSDEGSFLLTGDPILVDTMGKAIADLFGGRGGGKKGKFQGKGTKIRSALPDARATLMKGKQSHSSS